MTYRSMPSCTAVFCLIGLGAACGDDAMPTPDEESPGARSDAAADASRPAEDAARPQADAAGSDLPELCSGCPDEELDTSDDAAHFHHVHLNTHVPAESVDFYERVFGAQRVRLNGMADVLQVDGALLLMREVEEAPTDALGPGVEHFGWGRTDLLAWWEEAQDKQGVQLDQRNGTLEGPFELFPEYYFLYLQGPSNERIEVETEVPEYAQFKHVHFMTDDVDATVTFYGELLGVEPEMSAATETTLPMQFDGMTIAWTANTMIVDKVKMIFFGPPFSVPDPFVPSDDQPLGHVAFAFTDLDAALARADGLGAELVAGPAIDAEHGFRSAFVRGPNEVLIELVEAGPLL